ncbi:MAG: flagellar FlbD family protein [Myxococcota bacterium]|nr:flagellar FlbD family protein [Myxococcota bacterium]
MIWLTRVDGNGVLVNADHIVMVEGGQDAVVSLSTGEKLRVQESPAELGRRIEKRRREVATLEWLAPQQEEEG